MRIGIDISQAVFDGTGAQTYTRELVRSLITQFPHDQFVLFGASLRMRAKLKTVAQELPAHHKDIFVPIPPTGLSYLWNDLHALPIELFTGKLDVFHASDATQPPGSVPMVTTIHDLVAYTHPQTLDPGQLAIQKKRLAWVKRDCRMVITVSEATKRDVMTHLGVAPERITVVYEGARSQFSQAARNDTEKLTHVKQKYHLPERYLLNVGTLQPRKNLAFLLRAYQRLDNPLPLVVAGKVGWGETLHQVDNVLLLGLVDEADLPYVYAGAHAFVYPSLYEGFGLPVLEAMACGVPVITSNVSSLPEVGGSAALYIDPHDEESLVAALREVLSYDDLTRVQRSQAAIAQAQKFSWETAAQETYAVYQQVARQESPS